MTGPSRPAPPAAPAPSRPGRILPWAVALGCAAAAVAAWWTRPAGGTSGTPAAPAGEGVEPDAAGTPVEPDPGLERESAALRRCVARLEAARALLERCETPAAEPPPPPPPAAQAPAPPVACLARPEVAAEVERRVRAEVERTMELEAARREQARAARDDAARRILEQRLGLNTVESAWVHDFVCAARGMRRMAADEVIAGREAPVDAWRRLHRERLEVLRDLAAYLGRDRLLKLREFGGIGLVVDSIQCEDESR